MMNLEYQISVTNRLCDSSWLDRKVTTIDWHICLYYLKWSVLSSTIKHDQIQYVKSAVANSKYETSKLPTIFGTCLEFLFVYHKRLLPIWYSFKNLENTSHYIAIVLWMEALFCSASLYIFFPMLLLFRPFHLDFGIVPETDRNSTSTVSASDSDSTIPMSLPFCKLVCIHRLWGWNGI